MTPMRKPDRAGLVYSSDSGRVRPARPASPADGPTDGTVRIGRTTAGRGGRIVTVVTGLPASELVATASDLKRLCGSGGTVKDGTVEIQGDHRDRIAEHLSSRYRTKVAGGET